MNKKERLLLTSQRSASGLIIRTEARRGSVRTTRSVFNFFRREFLGRRIGVHRQRWSLAFGELTRRPNLRKWRLSEVKLGKVFRSDYFRHQSIKSLIYMMSILMN